MGTLLETQSARVDGTQARPVARESDAVQDLANLFEAQDHRQLLLPRGSNEGKSAPVLLDGMLKKELDATKGNGAGGSGIFPDILQVEKVLAKLFLCDLIGRFMVVLGKHAHCPDVHPLGRFRQTPELEIFDHSLFEFYHGLTSCVWMNGPQWRYRHIRSFIEVSIFTPGLEMRCCA